MSLAFRFRWFVNAWMRGRVQVSFTIAGVWKRLLARVTDKLWSALTVHTFDVCFQITFLRESTVAFRALYFLRHLTVHRSQVPLKITSIVKNSAQRWQENSRLIFQQRSTLVTTGKTQLNAQGCQLWNLTVRIDLVSKCCIISVMRSRWRNRNQQRRI